MADAVRTDRSARVVGKAAAEYAAAWEELAQAWNQAADAFEALRRAAESPPRDQVESYLKAQDRIALAWRSCEQKRASLDGAGAEYRAATNGDAAPDLSVFRMPPWQRLPLPGQT
jgi:hypothetical protein